MHESSCQARSESNISGDKYDGQIYMTLSSLHIYIYKVDKVELYYAEHKNVEAKNFTLVVYKHNDLLELIFGGKLPLHRLTYIHFQ